MRRLDPEVVTEEAADDDPEVYGDAWPLVEEWRRLRADHPHQGKSLSWLTTEERLLVLELAMLDDHGLTLPPETQALRGFGRRGQTTHRWKALADTRTPPESTPSSSQPCQVGDLGCFVPLTSD